MEIGWGVFHILWIIRAIRTGVQGSTDLQLKVMSRICDPRWPPASGGECSSGDIALRRPEVGSPSAKAAGPPYLGGASKLFRYVNKAGVAEGSRHQFCAAETPFKPTRIPRPTDDARPAGLDHHPHLRRRLPHRGSLDAALHPQRGRIRRRGTRSPRQSRDHVPGRHRTGPRHDHVHRPARLRERLRRGDDGRAHEPGNADRRVERLRDQAPARRRGHDDSRIVRKAV